MDSQTHPSGASDAGLSQWCDWHEDWSGSAREVRSIDRTSGPPFPLRACAPCRKRHALVAAADALQGAAT
ncbi:hypothetical protein AB0M39_02635 [Streptomyces sp. NPDC051907]|uniref:hypothetical protein n=1 Tax=Streptomyces sp. NPDC051907 TaxID=3155284 RepID=UPI003441EEF0